MQLRNVKGESGWNPTDDPTGRRGRRRPMNSLAGIRGSSVEVSPSVRKGVSPNARRLISEDAGRENRLSSVGSLFPQSPQAADRVEAAHARRRRAIVCGGGRGRGGRGGCAYRTLPYAAAMVRLATDGSFRPSTPIRGVSP